MATPFVPYRPGTITVTNGSVDFTGSGTDFSKYEAGDVLLVDGAAYRVEDFTSNTAGKWALEYPGADGSGLDYDWWPAADVTKALTLYASFQRFLVGGNLAAFAALDGTGGDKGIRLTGAGTMEAFDGPASKDGTETLSNKTISGEFQVHTNGNRIGITSGDAPLGILSAILHLVNEGESTCGFRVQAYWAGSAATPYQNNDCSLYEVFNTVEDASLNLSWAGSFCNGFNDIPAGVKDSGYRVGIKGWATSVCGPAAYGYEHRGVLEEQIGVWGTAGFQGSGSLGTPEINFARGVYGFIHNDIAGATIYDARAGFFQSTAAVGDVVDNYAVFAEARNGVNNYSFYGEAGLFRQKGKAQFDDEVDVYGPIKSAGVHVVESGTNSDGYWVRWSDGTQTCTKTVTLGSVSFSASGNIFASSIKAGGAFAVPFIAKPVVPAPGLVSTTGVVWAALGALATATDFPQFYLMSSSASTSATTSMELVATGRWY